MNCDYCGKEWLLDVPLDYHGPLNKKNSWHCDSYLCSALCEECQDWFKAIGEPEAAPVEKPPTPPADTENRKDYYKKGESYEKQFVARYPEDYRMNPAKEAGDIYAPDILYKGEVAELKARFTPLYLSYKNYGVDPSWANTINVKDVERYEKDYPNIWVVFWLWYKSSTEYSIHVPALERVHIIKFEDLKEVCRISPIIKYQRRENDDTGNAKDSYVIDLSLIPVYEKGVVV